MLKCWNRLCRLDTERLTKQVFKWDISNYKNKRGCWSYHVKHIFQDIECSNLFDCMSPCDIENSKLTLRNIDNTEWDIKRYKSVKLRYYNLYKCNNDKADYVTMNISKYQRSLYAQFRTGILPLEIEVGRFRNLDLSQRLCKVCNLQVVEDEIHFLCECPKYIEHRKSIFASATSANSDFPCWIP